MNVTLTNLHNRHFMSQERLMQHFAGARVIKHLLCRLYLDYLACAADGISPFVSEVLGA